MASTNVLAEPLLYGSTASTSCCSGRALAVVFVLVGFGLLLTPLPSASGRPREKQLPSAASLLLQSATHTAGGLVPAMRRPRVAAAAHRVPAASMPLRAAGVPLLNGWSVLGARWRPTRWGDADPLQRFVSSPSFALAATAGDDEEGASSASAPLPACQPPASCAPPSTTPPPVCQPPSSCARPDPTPPPACRPPSSCDRPRSYESGALSEFVTTSSGKEMPRLLYGTQGLAERTEGLVLSAVQKGFRGIDAVREPQQDSEPGVGEAVGLILSAGVPRDTLFIQTKVDTSAAAELSPDEPIAKQVEASIAKSLLNLRLEYVDSLLLNSHYTDHEQTMEAWRAMEDAVRSGLVRQLGISCADKSLAELQSVYADATLKPEVLHQPRLSASALQPDMRAWCAETGIQFQSYGEISRHPMVTSSLQSLADKYGVTSSVLFLRYMMGNGLVPVSGASSDEHLKEDMSARSVALTAEDAETVDGLLNMAALQQLSGTEAAPPEQASQADSANEVQPEAEAEARAEPAPQAEAQGTTVVAGKSEEEIREMCRKMRASQLKTELGTRNIRWADAFDKSELVDRLVVALVQEAAYCKSGRCKPGVVTQLSARELDEELADPSTPVLVDVFATWCGPCQMMAPKLEAAAKQMGQRVRVVKMDTDQEPQKTAQLNVQGFPTVILFNRQGLEVARQEGAVDEAILLDLVSKAGM
eukprot:gnl/TRDRNA2_/TRDRNA2_84230_c0_seq2.p1 gnl/TRDRNA2_/TRDRNA2_84230_c0~~gnl/TRDRNA2_/TRDRNA2_84230_c0_seq2.p1  ORF type:complete len:703 (-),score=121.92 gnl/TRDRNA2_/TRDRNA2_84230_c0_seq2:57-2165(-)